jgi:hypothetical protein
VQMAESTVYFEGPVSWHGVMVPVATGPQQGNDL